MAVGAAARYGARIVGKAAKKKLSRKAKKAVPKPTENQVKRMEQRAKFRQATRGRADEHFGFGVPNDPTSPMVSKIRGKTKRTMKARAKPGQMVRKPPSKKAATYVKTKSGVSVRKFNDPRAAGKMKRKPMDDIPW